jgi:threonine/homoserine/homoserine lactone efflux protein
VWTADIGFAFKGIVIGFSIAAPVGPIGVLCIQRTLTKGRMSGLVSGLGAASADAVYGCIAAFGLTFISTLLISQRDLIQFVGGLFLLYLGLRNLFFPKVAEKAAEARERGRIGDYFSTLALTLTNPVTILFFVAVFAGLGVAGAPGDYASAGLLVAGVFFGSSAWWLILSSIVDVFRERLTSGSLRWLNRVSGAIILVFGLVALAATLGAALFH